MVPNGTIGERWGEEGEGKWNSTSKASSRPLTLLGRHDELVEVTLPRFDGGETEGHHDGPRRAGPANRRRWSPPSST